MRQIGQYYIKKRLQQLSLNRGQQQATDMLTYIFKILSKLKKKFALRNVPIFSYSESGDDLGIDDLVDDFVTFYVFGKFLKSLTRACCWV